MNGRKRSRMVRQQNHERQSTAALVVSVLQQTDRPLSADEITRALDPLAPPELWWKVCGALESLEEQRRASRVMSSERRCDGARVYALSAVDERLREVGRIVEQVVKVTPLRELAKEF